MKKIISAILTIFFTSSILLATDSYWYKNRRMSVRKQKKTGHNYRCENRQSQVRRHNNNAQDYRYGNRQGKERIYYNNSPQDCGYEKRQDQRREYNTSKQNYRCKNRQSQARRHNNNAQDYRYEEKQGDEQANKKAQYENLARGIVWMKGLIQRDSAEYLKEDEINQICAKLAIAIDPKSTRSVKLKNIAWNIWNSWKRTSFLRPSITDHMDRLVVTSLADNNLVFVKEIMNPNLGISPEQKIECFKQALIYKSLPMLKLLIEKGELNPNTTFSLSHTFRITDFWSTKTVATTTPLLYVLDDLVHYMSRGQYVGTLPLDKIKYLIQYPSVDVNFAPKGKDTALVMMTKAFFSPSSFHDYYDNLGRPDYLVREDVMDLTLAFIKKGANVDEVFSIQNESKALYMTPYKGILTAYKSVDTNISKWSAEKLKEYFLINDLNKYKQNYANLRYQALESHAKNLTKEAVGESDLVNNLNVLPKLIAIIIAYCCPI